MSAVLLRRIAGGAFTSALIAATLTIAGAAPASAATCTTSTVLKVDGKNRAAKTISWGDFTSFSGEATVSGCGDHVTAGSMRLQRSVKGGPWRTIATGTSSNWVSKYGTKLVTKTARYRARYTGGADESSGHTFQASGDVATVKVIRTVQVVDKSTTRKSKGLFKIRPATSIRGMKVTFQRKKSGTWRFYKRLRVNKRGNVTTTFANSRKGVRYRVILPKGRGMVRSVHGPFIAYRY